MENKKKYIILKCDDYGVGNDENWKRFIDICIKRNVKANLGINAGSSDGGAYPFLKRVRYLVKDIFGLNNDKKFWKYTRELIEDGGLFELWNHSYFHKNFQEINDLKIVNDLIIKNQETVKRELGVTMRAFGAPYNKCSQLMQESLEALQDIKIWLYGIPNSKVPFVLSVIDTRIADIEDSNSKPNFEMFLKAYTEKINTSISDFLIIQLHPARHNSDSSKEIEKLLDFLLEQGHSFILLKDFLKRVSADA
ncbi:MAG: polysaccharide deacetylase family protein [Elusimicrobiota bacterium]|jgi:peptidoglycan/xylan/chitin deacetylase (PgdA/CDA1 family)|nr:polysaccharide deacetylase family protein [Elusimicrobiota bacterium]